MKEMYCITCPAGCLLKVLEYNNTLDFDVEGNGCEKGVEFAWAEIKDPMRSLTTTVRTSFPGIPVLPVRTVGEIPKAKLMEAMQALSSVVVSEELECGSTVVEDLVETGVRVIATSDMLTSARRSAEAEKKVSQFQDVLVTGTFNYGDYNSMEEEYYEPEEEVGDDDDDMPPEQDQRSGRARIDNR